MKQGFFIQKEMYHYSQTTRSGFLCWVVTVFQPPPPPPLLPPLLHPPLLLPPLLHPPLLPPPLLQPPLFFPPLLHLVCRCVSIAHLFMYQLNFSTYFLEDFPHFLDLLLYLFFLLHLKMFVYKCWKTIFQQILTLQISSTFLRTYFYRQSSS